MKFQALQENLRKKLWERIDAGELTGLRLADQTGFRQAHISNFLNGKRRLSLEGMDKVLSVQRISVLDLIDSTELNKRASILPPSEGVFDNVVVADRYIAASQAVIMSMHVKELIKFKKLS
jgi:transcriptional regulator with XRE-family HTH domain